MYLRKSIKGIKPQGKPWTRIKRNDPAASERGIKNFSLFLTAGKALYMTLLKNFQQLNTD